ncbi:MAG TPA: hypothetical protein VGQ59_10335 [Cyclobacteriaceae bacterium]|jgi:uncharacterized protein (UPF0248 family)|nr:hypothetical protein [Cyclobacteriaceae bacterium]
MIGEVREKFNASFSEKKYEAFLADLNQSFNYQIPFRVAESPVFVSKEFKHKLIDASNHIIDFLVRDDSKKLTERSIPKKCFVPNETDHTLFLALDFAVTKDEQGNLQPQLIEMQGFPSLFGWQDFVASKYKEHFYCPLEFDCHFDLTVDQYQSKLRNVLLNDHEPENVILLEIDPMKQNTAIDFIITEKISGIAPVHIGDIKREGRRLFYKKNGKTIPIHRIYNRVIFDELLKRNDLMLDFNLTEDVAVEWAGHPNWFLRISKYTMPMIKSKYVPECKFLNEYKSWPDDLENYVLKPLFSFSGTGVIFHLEKNDLDSIPENERENYLLQRKIQYEPVIQSPDGKVKTEIRLLFIWEKNQTRPIPVINLARLSRGEMIGVKFNKDKTWVGASVCFFEPG